MSSLINSAPAPRAMGLGVAMNLPRTGVPGSLARASGGRRRAAHAANGGLPLDRALEIPGVIAGAAGR